MADAFTLKDWVETWKQAGPELESIRDRELQGVDIADVILSMEVAYKVALRDFPPEPWSGLVEQQALFGKLRP